MACAVRTPIQLRRTKYKPNFPLLKVCVRGVQHSVVLSCMLFAVPRIFSRNAEGRFYQIFQPNKWQAKKRAAEAAEIALRA